MGDVMGTGGMKLSGTWGRRNSINTAAGTARQPAPTDSPSPAAGAQGDTPRWQHRIPASQQHLQVMLTAGEMGKIKAAPGDEKALSALCQPSPVILFIILFRSFYRTTLSVPQKLSYFWQISQGPPLNQDKFLSAPALPVIYNNLHSLIVSLKYHLWKNSSALLQRTWSKVSSSFKPESMLLLTTTLAQNHLQ